MSELNPSAVVRLSLRVRPSSRIAAFLGAIVVTLLAVVWLMLLLAIAASEEASIGLQLAWGLVAILFGLTLWGAWMSLREAFRRPHISVGSEAVRINNSGVLRRPLEVPIESILAVAVDTRDAPGFWSIDDLPVEIEHEHGPTTWRAGRDENAAVTHDLTRLFLPLLDRDPELAPNVALVLREEIDVSKLKRSTFTTGGYRKTVSGARGTQGFLACVSDPELSETVFRRIGLVRKLTWLDRELLEPRSEDIRRLRKMHHLIAFSIAYLTLSIAYQVWQFAEGGSP